MLRLSPGKMQLQQHLYLKVDADGGEDALVEVVVRKSQEQRRLPDRRVTNHHELLPTSSSPWLQRARAQGWGMSANGRVSWKHHMRGAPAEEPHGTIRSRTLICMSKLRAPAFCPAAI